MTREEMLIEIDLLRAQGHKIGIPGHVGEWTCEFDDVKAVAATLVEAFLAAKKLALKEKPDGE